MRARTLDAPLPELAARTIAERTGLRMLYEADAFTAVWVDRHVRPLPRARDAHDVLDAARRDGLDPAD